VAVYGTFKETTGGGSIDLNASVQYVLNLLQIELGLVVRTSVSATTVCSLKL
jgi:hypothetical protein